VSTVTLSRSVLSAAPGGEIGCDVEVANTTNDVLAVEVAVDGPAAEWAVVVPSALAVDPGGCGRARVTFNVPHADRLAGSARQFRVRVTGGTAETVAGRLEIHEVRDLRLSIHPLVSRGRGATTHTVTVENRGTGPCRAALMAGGTAGSLRLRLGAERVSVVPGGQATVDLTVKPRRRFLRGRSRPHPFTVEAQLQAGPPVTAAATRFQDPVRWRRGVSGAAAALAVATAGAFALRNGGTTTGAPLTAVAGAPVMPLALASGCPTTGTDALEIAGFAYCPSTRTVAAGAEVVWTNADLAPHTVTYVGPDGPVDSGSMAQGQSWSTRFGQPGTYRYYCRFHPGMTGTIVVESGP
jgi:plastocyanin